MKTLINTENTNCLYPTLLQNSISITKFLSLVLFFGLILYSCDKEDTVEVVGVWTITDAGIINCQDDSNNESHGNFSNSPCTVASNSDCIITTLSFSENKFSYTTLSRFADVLMTESGTGTYTLEDEILTMCEDGECDRFTIMKDGTSLRLERLAVDTGSSCIEQVFLIKN